MFCPNCGANIADNSEFCGVCGTNVSELISENEETERKEKESEEAKNKETESKGIESDNTLNVVKGNNIEEYPEYVLPKNKKNTKKWIRIGGIAVAVLMVILLLKGIIGLFSGNDNAYVYLSDGKYELITNLKKDTTIEISSAKSDDITSLDNMKSLVTFSPDGKYIYYYTKYDSYEGTGSLCRAEYRKLKENSSKNEKYIEIVATNVQLGFSMLEDGTLIYENGENNLYCYDGEESSQIAKSINHYYTDNTNRIVYTSGNSSDGYTLYGVLLNDANNKVKLASNYSYLCDVSDFDNISYVKEDDDYSDTLYVVGFDKESEKIAKDVKWMKYGQDGKLLFISVNDNALSLYDYVEDEYASEDAGITEPNQDDYRIPEYSHYMITDSETSEDDYGELYTSCTNDLYFYKGTSGWWIRYYSMEESLELEWGDNTEALHTETQAFIDEFADTADKNGYILVTNEVKNALKKLVVESGYSENDWILLCCTREETGTTIDYEEYNKVYEIYSEAKSRIDLRQELQDKENEYPVKTLYCFEDGELKVISDKILDWESGADVILYNTMDLVPEKENIQNISSTYDVTKLFELNPEAENYIASFNGDRVCQLSSEAAETVVGIELYFVGKELYMSDNEDGLYLAEVKKDVVESFSIITDDAKVLAIEDDVIYYAGSTYDNNGYTYFDLYECKNGKSIRLAQDIMYNNVNIYGDDVILAYTGYRSSHGYELTMIDSDGEKTLIADDVTQYIRVNEATILYIAAGDLYSYNGKERAMLRTEVDWLWSLESMEIVKTFGLYDGYY